MNFYLAAYPDLLANGITAATALDHFYTYGLNEGRSFSNWLSVDEFDFDTYAAKNEDLREAFGIEEDFDELTDAQKDALFSHFLAYGYSEDRPGVSPIFQAVVDAKNVIYANANGAYGTIADDEIRVEGDIANNTVLNGLGGNDTVVFNAGVVDNTEEIANLQSQIDDLDPAVDADEIEALQAQIADLEAANGTALAAEGIILRNVEEVIVNGDVEFTSEQLLNSLTINETATVAANFKPALVSGSADELNLNVDATGVVFTTAGFETVNVDLGKDAADFDLTADKSAGADQVINLTGGLKAADDDTKGTVSFTFENEGSAKLANLTIDATGLTGGLASVTLGDEVAAVKNITIKGATAASNTLEITTTDTELTENNTVTLIGGDKADTLNASAAIDTLTGGKGVNTFVFTAAVEGEGDAEGTPATATVKLSSDGKTIEATDSITDFKKGDKLDIGVSGEVHKFVKTGSAVDLTTLEATVAAASKVEGEAVAFEFGDKVYVYLGGYVAADDENPAKLDGVELVQISGVNVTVDNLVAWDVLAGA